MKIDIFDNVKKIAKSFPKRIDKELYLISIGYHNFIIDPTRAYERRTQSMYTLHYIISGSGTLNTAGKTYTLKAGDVFVLKPNQIFTYYANKENPWTYIFFQFNGSLADQYLSNASFNKDSPVNTITQSAETLLITAKRILSFNKANSWKMIYFEDFK